VRQITDGKAVMIYTQTPSKQTVRETNCYLLRINTAVSNDRQTDRQTRQPIMLHGIGVLGWRSFNGGVTSARQIANPGACSPPALQSYHVHADRRPCGIRRRRNLAISNARRSLAQNELICRKRLKTSHVRAAL